jgi:uncharacterized membrane protein
VTNPPPPPPGGNYPPPPPPPPPGGGGGYGPPPGEYRPQGGYPPPPQQGGYPPPGGGYPPQQGGYPPPGGGYPPQQGGYPPPPPPQQGGYPPAPGGYPLAPGGYGAPPPGYPPAGAPGYPSPREVDIGQAFGWAWNKFTKNAAVLIVPTLVYGLVIGALSAIIFFIAGALAPSSVSTYGDYSASYSFNFGFLGLVVLFFGAILVTVLAGAAQSAYLGGLLDIANGQSVTIGTFFRPRNVVNVVIASFLIGVASAIGSIVFIGSLVVALFTLFAVVALVERNLSAIDGIKASFELVKNNFVQALITYLIVALIISVGFIACFIGILISLPVGALYLVYAYRKLTGGEVAPLTP